jgi:hypothetical protein
MITNERKEPPGERAIRVFVMIACGAGILISVYLFGRVFVQMLWS